MGLVTDRVFVTFFSIVCKYGLPFWKRYGASYLFWARPKMLQKIVKTNSSAMLFSLATSQVSSQNSYRQQSRSPPALRIEIERFAEP